MDGFLLQLALALLQKLLSNDLALGRNHLDALRVAQRPSSRDGHSSSLSFGCLHQVHVQRVLDSLSQFPC